VDLGAVVDARAGLRDEMAARGVALTYLAFVAEATVAALRRYQRLRDRLAPPTGTSAVFVSTAGTRLLYCSVQHAFGRLVRVAGLAPRSGSCRPRIQRHSFAVAAMLDAYAAGQDGQTRLSLLSTWLGHVHPASTYWYLSASPELMAIAGQRLDAHLLARSAGRS